MDVTLHMIGNAHLDPVWLWRWPEGCAEALATCWSALDRLEETPGFVFTRGEAQIYDWLERLDPALFVRVREAVRQGRWAVTGGWWNQPDCNLPGGESFLRQALYGRRFLREHLNLPDAALSTAYCVDAFGHAATLPMLLRHSGFSHYVFMRPGPHETPLPPLFDWEAPDGSSVRAYRIQDSYHTTFAPLEPHLERHLELLRADGLPRMCFYGVGDHGGGPTKQHLGRIERGIAAGEPLEYSDPERYFAAVRDLECPTVEGELQQHAIGCYSALAPLKKLMRRCEAALADAEAALALGARHLGDPYPHARLEALWCSLLEAQFHDTLGGTCTQEATADALEALSGTVSAANVLTEEALRRLAGTVAPRPEAHEAAFLVVNLSGQDFRGPLEYEPWLGWDDRTERVLLDHGGLECPVQDLRPHSRFMGMRRLLFRAEVPAFGYRLYRLAEGVPTPPQPGVRVEGLLLENARHRLTLDPASGGILSLCDRLEHRELFPGGAHAAFLADDPSDTWGHGLSGFPFEGENFVLERCEVLESGPLRAALRCTARAGRSTLETTYLLHADPEAGLELRVKVDWREQGRALRLRYGAGAGAQYRFEVPYGALERPADGRELPVQRFVQVRSPDGFCTLLACEAVSSGAAQATGAGSDLFLTPLRAPAYAHHEPRTLEGDPEVQYTDQREHTLRLRFRFGQDLKAAEAYRLAEHLTRPPRILPHVSRGGTAPHAGVWLEPPTGEGVVTWLKGAEEGGDLVLRVLEVEGQGTDGGASPALRAHGLHSFRIGGDHTLRPSDALER